MDDALFVPRGGRWLPTELARSPWQPDALHGGPVAALAARAVEHCPNQPDDGAARHVVRLSVELLRPVPLEPLAVEARLARPGRKVQLVDVTISTDSGAVALARAVRIGVRAERASSVAGSPTEGSGTEPRVLPGPEHARPGAGIEDRWIGFHNQGVELRFVTGGFDQLGPAVAWCRLAVPVVPDEAPSPLQRAAAAADFTNGLSAVLDFHRWRYVNPDLTVVVERPAVGEWIGLEAETTLGIGGVGVARAVLYDRSGPVGTGTQTLVVEPR
jgi:hypothetical protein